MPETTSILLSFVGNRDPYVEGSDQYGPVLSLLEARQFGRVVLFCTGPAFVERARSVQEIAARDLEFNRFGFVDVDLDSPIDYEEIYRGLESRIRAIQQREQHRRVDYSVLLDPGTPQMQTAWFLLVRGGALDATLLQGIPPRFAAGSYRVKVVDFNDTRLPTVSLPPVTPQLSASSAGPAAAKGGSAPEAAIGGPPPADSPWVSVEGDRIIATSPTFQGVLDEARRLARYDISVLIEGETGSGKNIIARQIHEASPRRGETFASLNCSAISATLAEATLFGQKKGAFTDAKSDRLGYFRTADGGTLFFDEVGDLPLEIQPKLLRVLEDGSMSPLGDDREYRVDVRVIAATNHDLESMVEAGTFRQDLYQRLRQGHIVTPPLRERREDIAPLIAHFAERWNVKYHEEKRISQGVLGILLDYHWPGNVREVEHLVQDMFARARGRDVGEELLPPRLSRKSPDPAETEEPEEAYAGPCAVRIPAEGVNIRELLSQLERDYYREARRLAQGNGEKAAQLLGITGAAYRKAMRDRFPE
jgi:DNA-binding NtrC family response regulator